MKRTQVDAEPSLTGPSPEGERGRGLRAVGAAAARLAGPIVAKSAGGVVSRLKAAWPAIAGPELAAIAWPESLSSAGVLRLRVAPAHALDLQHRAPLALERVNIYFGREVASRLALVQGPLPFAAPAATRARPIPAGAEESLARQVAAVSDPELRAALSGLGRAILAAPEDDR